MLKSSLWMFTVATMTYLTIAEYLCHGYIPLDVSTHRSFPHSWLVIWFVTSVIRRVPLVEQEQLTLNMYEVKRRGSTNISPVLHRIHIYFVFYDTALILCLFCRKFTLIHWCLYLVYNKIEWYNYPLVAPFDIFCQKEVNWIYN